MAFSHPPCTPLGGFNAHALLGGESWTQLKAAPARQETQYCLVTCTQAVQRALQGSHRPASCRSNKGSLPCLWEAGSVHMAGMPTWNVGGENAEPKAVSNHLSRKCLNAMHACSN